jgi:hypothetical protein
MDRSADFSGTWRLNEYESKVPAFGSTNTPYKLEIVQQGDELHMKSASIVEWDDDEVSEQTLMLDGRDNVSTGSNDSRRVQNARFSAARDTLTIDTRMSLVYGGRQVEIRSQDVWTLKRRGKQLVIVRTAESSRGPVESILVYDRQ